jgi:hypothetical protein
MNHLSYSIARSPPVRHILCGQTHLRGAIDETR